MSLRDIGRGSALSQYLVDIHESAVLTQISPFTGPKAHPASKLWIGGAYFAVEVAALRIEGACPTVAGGDDHIELVIELVSRSTHRVLELSHGASFRCGRRCVTFDELQKR
jgi:hypothetical protein